jgi:hypothetical protein
LTADLDNLPANFHFGLAKSELVFYNTLRTGEGDFFAGLFSSGAPHPGSGEQGVILPMPSYHISPLNRVQFPSGKAGGIGY